MELLRGMWRRIGGIGIALFLALAPALAAAEIASPDSLRRQATKLEQQGKWEQACDLYDQLLARDRNQPELRERFLVCLRQAHFQRRHHDAGFRDQILNQDLAVALRAYGEVLGKLRDNFVDKDKADLTRLFHSGVEELRLALNDPEFRREHLPTAAVSAVEGYRTQLKEFSDGRVVRNLRDAQGQALELALSAQKAVDLRPAVTVLELACGACNGLDEHTAFLTASQLGEVYASLEGGFVGIGVEVAVVDHKLVVTQVLTGSSAAAAGIKPGDSILRIDKKPVEGLAAESAAEHLRGIAGTTADVEILPLGEMKPRTLGLTRQVVTGSSVVEAKILNADRGIAYCRVAAFQKATAQELDEVLSHLQMQGMNGLVLDLRSNPGGLLPVAVQVAERFLAEGVIVTTQGQVLSLGRTYRANNPAALTFPLVVLIDGDTASAAEIVASALKDHQRAMLIGQPTFGKGSIQRVIGLESVPAGLRVTLARFFSPRGQPVSAGVAPDIPVARDPMSLRDPPLEIAVQEIGRLILQRQESAAR